MISCLVGFLASSLAPNAYARVVLPFEWDEIRTKSFVIIYPAIEGAEKEQILSLYEHLLPPDQRDLGHVILIAYGDTIEKEYQRATNLFGTTLDLPISIRVYPKEANYFSLNAYAPSIKPNATHSHIGDVEISLIAENIIKNPLKWESEALNAFRYEVSALLVEKLSKGKAPPALIESISFYLLDPAEALAPIISEADPSTTPVESIRNLWSNSSTVLSTSELIHSISIISLLVEKFGWQQVLVFLEEIPNSEDIAATFETTFNMPLDGSFKELWTLYYPAYIHERWQYHFLYKIDEGSYRKLIQAGAYSDAKLRLEEHINLLQGLNEFEKANQLGEILRSANMGLQGIMLLQEARQNYIAGDTEGSLDQLNQAIENFRQINDSQRLAEAEALEKSIKHAQTLSNELKRRKWFALLMVSPNQVKKVTQLMAELIRVGNKNNAQQINQVLVLMRIRAIVLGMLSLLGLFFFSLRRLRAWHKNSDQETYL